MAESVINWDDCESREDRGKVREGKMIQPAFALLKLAEVDAGLSEQSNSRKEILCITT